MEKQEKKNKRLDMADMMTKSGLGAFLNPFTSTTFTVTHEIHNILMGQIEWIRLQLPIWMKIINDESGASIEKIDVSVREYENKPSFKKSLKIVAKIFIKGGIVTAEDSLLGHTLREADPDIMKKMPGLIRKVLFEKIEGDFPLPFDVSKPLFLAGHPYHFCLEGWGSRGGFIGSEVLNNFSESKFLMKILSCVYEHGAKMVGIKCEGQNLSDLIRDKKNGGIFNPAYLIVKWDRDTTWDDQWQLFKELDKLIREELALIGRKINFSMEAG